MKKILIITAILLFCIINIGVCADKVVVVPLFSDSRCEGNATAENVLSGKTFSNSIDKGITGTIPNIAPQNITPGTTEQTIIKGYHDGTGKVLGDADLLSGNIKYGVTIFGVTGTNRSYKCGAYVTTTAWKIFDCYNLAAMGQTTNADPFTPSWRLIGGYWQWGRKGPDSSLWYFANTPNFFHGPTGSDAGNANEGAISAWDMMDAPDGSWSDASKTVNDPCPAGYRVPTKTQWDGVDNNNTHSTVGTWSDSATNYSSARFFGDDLMLPAAGHRYFYQGALESRGFNGYYWSSTHSPNSSAWHLSFYSSNAGTGSLDRRFGYPVRCVVE